MTDDRRPAADQELIGLNPFDLLDREAGRLDAFFAGLDGAGWRRASRCAGWSVRDVLGHLLSAEDYHRACLDGAVAAFIAGFGERGATDLDSANALGVADYSALSVPGALRRWETASAENRRRFRERGDGTVDTSVGEYPCRWQGFHVASELATHADDIEVPVSDDERGGRRAWRARFSRFALAEAKPGLEIRVIDGRTVVRGPAGSGGAAVPVAADVDDDELIEGVMARLGETSRLDPAVRQLLSTMP